ncbi:MFS transporter [Priestia endophytica]|jgi:MFS family permease|uniref:MFS transporter n=1 Tax=Priestia endophytica TaxID=135735 RepID=UPI00124EFCFF|nr:MFS transporter [Priestia endophytica]KAB2495277.1 MFS transporter [Priestia endophytica]
MKNKSFYFLLGGQTLANFGDSLYVLVLTLLTYQLTNSTLIASMVAVLQFVGQSLGAVLIPLFMYQYRLKQLIVYLQICQITFFGYLVFIYILQLTTLSIPLFFIIVFLLSLIDGGTIPVRNSMIPRLVEKHFLLKANSYILTSDQIVLLLGWLLGGILIGILGPLFLLLTTLVLYCLSLISMLIIVDTGAATKQAKDQESFAARVFSGWKMMYQKPTIRTFTILEMLSMCGRSIWTGAIILVYVKEVLHQSETWWGFINASYFAGTILGGIFVLRFAKHVQNRLFDHIFYSSIIVAVMTLCLGLNQSAWLSLLFVFLLGPAFQLRGITIRTYVQDTLNHEELPKVLSAQHTLSTFIYGMSILIMSTMTDLFGVRVVFFMNVILFTVSAILSFRLKNEQI